MYIEGGVVKDSRAYRPPVAELLLGDVVSGFGSGLGDEVDSGGLG